MVQRIECELVSYQSSASVSWLIFGIIGLPLRYSRRANQSLADEMDLRPLLLPKALQVLRHLAEIDLKPLEARALEGTDLPREEVVRISDALNCEGRADHRHREYSMM